MTLEWPLSRRVVEDIWGRPHKLGGDIIMICFLSLSCCWAEASFIHHILRIYFIQHWHVLQVTSLQCFLYLMHLSVLPAFHRLLNFSSSTPIPPCGFTVSYQRRAYLKIHASLLLRFHSKFRRIFAAPKGALSLKHWKLLAWVRTHGAELQLVGTHACACMHTLGLDVPKGDRK